MTATLCNFLVGSPCLAATAVTAVAINAAAFLLYGRDKALARKRRRRVRERTLMGVALLGGATGALAGMHVFRHKTRHLKFRLGVPLALLVQWAAALYLLAAWLVRQ